jgi:hypothetical protein
LISIERAPSSDPQQMTDKGRNNSNGGCPIEIV